MRASRGDTRAASQALSARIRMRAYGENIWYLWELALGTLRNPVSVTTVMHAMDHGISIKISIINVRSHITEAAITPIQQTAKHAILS